MQAYSLLVTACDRDDLLERTVKSFIDSVEERPREIVIVEDGPDRPMPVFLQQYKHLNLKWLTNSARMGQIYSCDRLWSECTNDFAFWCEDDWEFSGSFIRQSFTLLEKYPDLWTVSLRAGDCNGHPLVNDPRFPVQINEPYWNGVWGGCHFNPGLRRKSDYLRIGSYGRHTAYGTAGCGHEKQLSKMHLDMGYRIAALPTVHVTHTGGSRSRACEPMHLRLPRILIGIPVCHKFEYGKWESSESPHFNAANAYNGKPYGTDIHISGANPRVAALRDTWLKDVSAFSSHVTYKLFYGQPHDRPAANDEVYLDTPDDYAGLPKKTVGICRWAVNNDFDYLFKADDDSYVWVDRLIQEVMAHRFDYAGHEQSGVCSGGPGYWLSKRAMKYVATQGSSDHWAEDVTVARIMDWNNIHPTMLPNHHPGFTQHWYDINKVPANSVCIHALKPDTMRELYQREHQA